MGHRHRRHEQLELPLKLRGGRRPGSGRKRETDRRRVAHAARSALSAHDPVHITMRLKPGLPSLRRDRTRKVLHAAFKAGCARPGFRLIHFSIQSNHLHLLVEANDRTALSRGMQGLAIRMARGLNRLWRRRGRVFADRYHRRSLRTPREVRNALVYVLQNARKHGVKLGRRIDSFASGRWFDGWGRCPDFRVHLNLAAPVVAARSWLLRVGWRRHGLIDPWECPRVPT